MLEFYLEDLWSLDANSKLARTANLSDNPFAANGVGTIHFREVKQLMNKITKIVVVRNSIVMLCILDMYFRAECNERKRVNYLNSIKSYDQNENTLSYVIKSNFLNSKQTIESTILNAYWADESPLHWPKNVAKMR